jgi:hypothetical protein
MVVGVEGQVKWVVPISRGERKKWGIGMETQVPSAAPSLSLPLLSR